MLYIYIYIFGINLYKRTILIHEVARSQVVDPGPESDAERSACFGQESWNTQEIPFGKP